MTFLCYLVDLSRIALVLGCSLTLNNVTVSLLPPTVSCNIPIVVGCSSRFFKQGEVTGS